MRASIIATCGLWSAGSVDVEHGLSCLVACVIFPDRGSKLCLLHWQAVSLSLSHYGILTPILLLLHTLLVSYIKLLPRPVLGSISPVFFFLGVLQLQVFKLLIHFKLIFVRGAR